MGEPESGRNYGPHLTVDAYGCPRAALASLDNVATFLDRMPEVIGMEKITKPYAFRHLAPPDPEWGITGFVVIATSHISIHTYPERGVAFMDVFSCRQFETTKAMEFFNEMFKSATSDIAVVRRGKAFHSAGVRAPVGS